MSYLCRVACLLAVLVALTGCDTRLDETQSLADARSYLKAGDLPAASVQLKGILQENPDSGEARLLLGQVQLEAGDPRAAEKELQRATELGVSPELVMPALADSLLQQDNNSALQALSQDTVADPQAAALIFAAQAMGNLRAGQTELAALQIEQARLGYPDSPYVQVANASLSIARWEEEFARDELRQILDQTPDYAPAWSLLGNLQRRQGQLAEAENSLTQAIDNRQANLSDRMARAQVRIALGLIDEAQADLNVISRDLSNHPEANYAQGLIYWRQKKFPEAAEAFQKTLALDSKNANATYFLGMLSLQQGNVELADSYARRFFSMHPNAVPGRKLLAAVHLAKRETDGVPALLAPVLEADPDDIEALTLVADALVRNGDSLAALPYLERLLGLQPETAAVGIQYAAALFATGEPEAATRQVESVLQQAPKASAAYRLLVREQLKQEAYPSALQTVERMRTSGASKLDALALEAQIRLASGDAKAAAAALNTIEDLDPGNRQANHALARLAMDRRDYPDAESYYRRVLAVSPEDISTLLSLARVKALQRDEAAMVSLLEAAREARPGIAAPSLMLARYYYSQAEFRRVLAELRDLPVQGVHRFETLQLQGMAGLGMKDFDAARDRFQQLIALKPDSGGAYYLLSRSQVGLGDLPGMRESLEAAAELEPDSIAAGTAYAAALLVSGDNAEAARQLDRIEAIHKGSPATQRMRGMLARERGNKAEALEFFQQLFEEQPTTENMLITVAQMWEQGDQSAAIALQEAWLTDNPNDVKALETLAQAYVIRGDSGRAAGLFETVVELDESNYVALNELAWMLREEDPDQAYDYVLRALELSDNNPVVLDTAAVIAYHRGEYDVAREFIDQALAAFPDEPTLRYHGAMIDVAMGRRDQAMKTLVSILEAQGEFAERGDAEQLLAQLRP